MLEVTLTSTHELYQPKGFSVEIVSPIWVLFVVFLFFRLLTRRNVALAALARLEAIENV